MGITLRAAVPGSHKPGAENNNRANGSGRQRPPPGSDVIGGDEADVITAIPPQGRPDPLDSCPGSWGCAFLCDGSRLQVAPGRAGATHGAGGRGPGSVRIGGRAWWLREKLPELADGLLAGSHVLVDT
jgi:hypothetical protein